MAYPLIRVAQFLLDTAQNALTLPVDYAHLAPGQQIAWDGGNLLAVRTVSVQPVQGASVRCVEYEATLGVVVLRCVEALTSGGNVPWSSDITLDASPILRDCHEIGQALSAIRTPPCTQMMTLNGWTSQGPEGGVAGGEWSVTVLLPTLDYSA